MPSSDSIEPRIPNYLFHFTVLNTHSVPVSWLHNRAQRNGNEGAPDVWKDWVRTGEVRQWPTGEQLDRRAGHSRRYEIEEIAVSETFRTETFERYGHACTITGIAEEPLLDLAHILPRSERPDLAEHPENVIVLNSLHHRAFDAGLFTLDSDYRIRVSPAFDPGHPFLRETIIERQAEQLSLPSDARIRGSFLEELNDGLAWI
jgi:predicted restriction endonuclease